MPRFLSRTFRILLLAALVGVPALMFLGSGPRPAGGTCGDGAAPARATVPLASLAIGAPMYAVERSGRLQKLDPVTGSWRTLAGHAFEVDPSVVVSADGRWFAYEGVERGGNTTDYWLVDKKTGQERLVHRHPAWGGSIPAFAPNSASLAIYANHDSRWPAAAGVGLYIVDVATFESVAAGMPGAFAADGSWAHMDWSADGGELLLMIRDFKKMGEAGESRREHYAWRLATKAYERIAGEFTENGGAEKFFRDGARIATFVQRSPQSSRGEVDVAAPGGGRKATIGRDQRLVVSAPDGTATVVAEGALDPCSGSTVVQHGWLDADRLVFSERDTAYVFDAKSGRYAELFHGMPRPAAFLW